jgi:hypothetical protein
VDFEAQYVSTARVEGTVRDLDGQPVRSGQISLIPKLEDAALMSSSFFFLDSVMMMRPRSRTASSASRASAPVVHRRRPDGRSASRPRRSAAV